MGKIKRQKAKKKPEILPDECLLEGDLEVPTTSTENVIQTILDQLQAANVEEKYCGLQTLALFIENADNVGEVLSNNLIKSAAPLLLDQACSVRNGAAGSLRNLSATGFNACIAMMEQDIMTPLVAYFHQYTEAWAPKLNSKTKKPDVDTDTFIQCVNLLWNLCESSELAVKYLNESNIFNILSKYLDITLGNEVIIAILQCLFVVIEDNPIAIEKIKSNAEEKFQQLLALEGNGPTEALIKTLAAGVVINLSGGNIIQFPPEVLTKITSILANTLSIDHRLACHQLSSFLPLSNGGAKAKVPEGKAGIELESKMQAVLHLLEAQQSAVEIITNLCSCEDGDDIMEDDGSDSEEADDALSNEGSGSGDVTCLLPEDKLPTEVIEAFTALELFDKVWARTHLPADNVMLIFKEYEGSALLYKKLQSLQCRSLLCINNMLSSLPLTNLGELPGVYKIWVETGKLVFKQNSTENQELLESATAVMRAALERIKMSKEVGDGKMFGDLALSDIEMMVNGIRECQVGEIRSNLIRMIGTLALLLTSTQNETAISVVVAITEFLLDLAHKENELYVLAEALDTLMDMYSEDDTDVLAAQTKLVDKMSALAPILKNKARQQRKSLGEQRVLVDTATSNLPRFIAYKKKRLAKLKP